MNQQNAQLNDNLSHSSYMFWHYCVILREFIVNTLLSYVSMLMQSWWYNLKFHMFYAVNV